MRESPLAKVTAYRVKRVGPLRCKMVVKDAGGNNGTSDASASTCAEGSEIPGLVVCKNLASCQSGVIVDAKLTDTWDRVIGGKDQKIDIVLRMTKLYESNGVHWWAARVMK